MADVGKNKNKFSDAIMGSDPTEIEKLQEKQRKEARARRKKEDLEDINAKYRYEEDRIKARQLYEWKERERQINEEHDMRMEHAKYQAKYGETLAKRVGASLKMSLQDIGKELERSAKQAVATTLNAAVQSVDNAIGLLNQYQASISTRAQGAATFQDMYKLIKQNVGSSPWVKQTQVLENLSKLVSEGITFNVEQRAFLNTIKDNIATTFDAANGTLLQLIRIQQADSTAARLGMEAYLTNFLNRTFQDTSYLNQGYDVTSASLLAMSASAKSTTEAAELEFIAQKWLGSLAAVGVSDSTLQMLAQGINALGSGDVTALSSNSAMKSLFAMATSRGGLSLGESLTGGLTANNLNKLMESIVTYGQQIASSTNAVVRNQYAQLFGMSVSDLRALQNLSTGTISDIAKTNLSYGGMMKELGDQYSQIGNRLPISQMVSNVLDNLTTNIGMGVANNPATFAAWMVNSMVEKATGGINIPSVMGNSVNATVNQLAKIALVAFPLMSTIGEAIGNLTSGEDILGRWGLRNGTIKTRGATEVSLGQSVTGLKSQSTYVGSSDTDAMYQQTLTAANERQEEVKGEEYTDTRVRDAIIESIDPNTKAILELLQRAVSGASPIKVEASRGMGWR